MRVVHPTTDFLDQLRMLSRQVQLLLRVRVQIVDLDLSAGLAMSEPVTGSNGLVLVVLPVEEFMRLLLARISEQRRQNRDPVSLWKCLVSNADEFCSRGEKVPEGP